MAMGPSGVWILFGAVLAVVLFGFLFAYLQVHYGMFIRDPFGPPKLGIVTRFRSMKSPFSKIWLAYRWLYVRFIHSYFRSLFTRPEVSLTIFALAPVAILGGYWVREGFSIEPLILATLFYASVIFFKEFFLADYPLVDLNPTLRRYEGQLTVVYEVANIGSKSISNLNLSHAVYDGNGRWLRGTPEPLNYRKEKPISINPGETSDEFRVPLEKSIGFESEFDEWNTLKKDTPTPIFIEISAAPSIGHRFLADRYIVRFDPNWGQDGSE